MRGEWKSHVQFTCIRMQKLRHTVTYMYFSLLCTVLRSTVAPVIQCLPFQISKDQALPHPCPLAPHVSLAKPNPCVHTEECLPSCTPGTVDSEADLKREGVGGRGKQSWSKIFGCRPTYLYLGSDNLMVILPRVMKVGPMMRSLVELYLHASQTNNFCHCFVL